MSATPIRALIISNGIEGLHSLYQPTEAILYDWVEVTPNFNPKLDGYDLLIVPNGSDHIALYRIKDRIKAFLDAGGALFCFDGWFTDWVPGYRWLMDNTQKSIDVRYKIKDDPFQLSQQFEVEDLNFSHGISGWWACGYIECVSPLGHVLIEDTWGRPLVVIDETTTAGLMVLTASAPAADLSYATTDDGAAEKAMTDLYHALLGLISLVKQPTHV